MCYRQLLALRICKCVEAEEALVAVDVVAEAA